MQLNRTNCRLCKSLKISVFFNLVPTPLANQIVSVEIIQEIVPLDMCVCLDCCHIQLLQIVNPSDQYTNYVYLSSGSNIMIHHLKTNVDYFLSYLNIEKTDNILEIGANDGVCINHLITNGYINTIGVDPAKNINRMHSLPIICDFFGQNII